MADAQEPPPDRLRSLQDELAALMRRSLAQRTQNEETAARMREVATEITKFIGLRTTAPAAPNAAPEPE